MQVNERLIQVNSFDNPIDANMFKSRLESEGIQCFLPDEHTVSTYMFLSTAVGNIRVMVKESDYKRAEEIAEDFRSDITADEEIAEHGSNCTPGEICPECGSEETACFINNKRRAALSIILLGFPLFFPSKECKCSTCTYEWVEKQPASVTFMKFVIYSFFILVLIMVLDGIFSWI